MTFVKGHKLNIGNQYAKGHKHTEEWKRQQSERLKGNTNGFTKGYQLNKGIKHKVPSHWKGKKLPYTIWNKGKRYPQIKGEKNYLWKGEGVTYGPLHSWVRRWLGKPCECSECGKTGYGRQMHWANISHEYKRDLSDWVRLCPSCHKKYDKNKLTLISHT